MLTMMMLFLTEFAALESELEVIERDLTEITQSIELYKGSDLYDRLKGSTAEYEITRYNSYLYRVYNISNSTNQGS